MFQRLKAFNLDSLLDTKIAEEQARQNNEKQGRSDGSARRSASTAGTRKARPTRAESPANKVGKPKTADTLQVQNGRGVDPDDFVIGDDGSDISRAATPRPVKESEDPLSEASAQDSETAAQEKGKDKVTDEILPEDVRRKLAKLDHLMSKYQDLLRNYRAAHARVAHIEPFESTLREHTPLTNINDPSALIEFLDQRNRQGDMVMEELKRISGEHIQVTSERDDLKSKLEIAERKGKASAPGDEKSKPDDNDTFFSQDDEIAAGNQKYEAELKKQVAYINELETENAQYRQDHAQCTHDLEIARLDLDAVSKKIDLREQDNKALREQIATFEAEKQGRDEKDGKNADRDEKKLKTYEEVVNKLRGQVKETEDARKGALSKVNDLNFEIKRLEAEVSSSGSIIASLRPFEQRSQSLQKDLEEAERLRYEAQRVVDAKKGHEAAAASLRVQLRRAVEDRDAAYQMIVDCGKCKKDEDDKSAADDSSATRSRSTSDQTDETPETPQTTEPSTPADTENPTLGSEGVTTDGKKKKKKKPKNKKKVSESSEPLPTMEDMVKDPMLASRILGQKGAEELTHIQQTMIGMLQKQRDSADHDVDAMRLHFEGMIEERDQKLKDQVLIIRDRDDKIERLKSLIEERVQIIERMEKKLKDQESLEEEIETLRESLTDVGGSLTNAKRDATDANEKADKLQSELETAETDGRRSDKQLSDIRMQHNAAVEKCEALERQLSEVKDSKASIETDAALNQAKTELDNLRKTHESLQQSRDALQQELERTKAQQSSKATEDVTKAKSLSADLERSQSRATTLETDLAAANLLAQNRYKELTEIKDHFSKVQPEVKRLREESAQLKSIKTELDKSNSTIRQLESKQRDLKAEIAEYKTQSTKRDGEIADLKDKVKKSRERCSALEDTYERSRKDIEEHQRTRDEALDAREKLQQQVDKAQQDRRSLKLQLDDLEKQVKKFSDEARGLRDELQIKSAKHASAQSHMTSMQDQSNEMATQMREAQQRCNSLEEELADSQRLLSERSREAETMRRLLADVETRAETRVKEMRERLDLATEERDRAEDESNSLGRKKAREVEDYKNRLRDLERDITRANDGRADAEKRETDIRQRQEDVERRLTQAQTEVTEVRQIMSQLREALDEGERQAKDLEKQKTDLRRNLDEREVRLEKLQKSSKAMAEELRLLQSRNQRQGSIVSSRDSMESNARVLSPGPKPSTSSNGPSAGTGKVEAMDYVYLKNILLQFLEQKEKKTQMQLIPVLGMLLHFDKSDEAKWMSVVSTK